MTDSALELGVADGEAIVARAWEAGWTMPPQLTVSEWADRSRRISRAAGAEHGPWRTERTPYLREIMDALSAHSPVREVSIMKSTQVGGTEVLNNWVGYIIDHQPGPTMVVMPTLDIAEKWSKQRLTPMIADCPALVEKVAPVRSRDSGNTTLLKEFAGGVLSIAGANSSSGLRSMPVKFLAMDEIDEYEADLNEQGSAIELAERRTSTFARRKIARVSTPTIKDASNIERYWLAGDMRRYHVPCPHCDARQHLEIDQLTDDGQYLCQTCGTRIGEHEKPAMLAAGAWVAEHPERTERSYHINALYSPIGLGYSWAEIAALRLAARRDSDLQVTFTNTILGLPYAGAGQRVESNELVERAEKWRMRTIPRGALILTAAVDVQHNRWAVQINGWGRGEQCWFVDYAEIPGDPTKEEDWAHLDQYLFQPITNSCGVAMRPQVIGVDSGNWTHEVYGWVRKNQHRGVFALKGSNQPNRPVIGRPVAQDVRLRGRMFKNGVQLWTVGVHTIKTTLFARLVADAGLGPEERRIHFPGDLPREFYDMLTAEHFDVRHKRWLKKSGARNEAFDCFVYNYAAACHPLVRLHVKREADWAALERKLEPANTDLFAGDAPATDDTDGAEEALPPPPPPNAVPRETQQVPPARHWSTRRGGWMKGAPR